MLLEQVNHREEMALERKFLLEFDKQQVPSYIIIPNHICSSKVNRREQIEALGRKFLFRLDKPQVPSFMFTTKQKKNQNMAH